MSDGTPVQKCIGAGLAQPGIAMFEVIRIVLWPCCRPTQSREEWVVWLWLPLGPLSPISDVRLSHAIEARLQYSRLESLRLGAQQVPRRND